MSNDGHCLVCEAIKVALEKPAPSMEAAVVACAIGAYVEGLEDEGVAQRDRFCLTHRVTFDARLRSDPELHIFDPFRP